MTQNMGGINMLKNILLIDWFQHNTMSILFLAAVNIDFDKRGPQIEATFGLSVFYNVPLLGEYDCTNGHKMQPLAIACITIYCRKGGSSCETLILPGSGNWCISLFSWNSHILILPAPLYNVGADNGIQRPSPPPFSFWSLLANAGIIKKPNLAAL